MLMAIGGLMITNPQLINVVRQTGALAVCALYVVMYTHTPECFPTMLRGQFLAIPDGLSKIPVCVTPFLGLLYQYNRSYYWLVNLSIIGAAMIACLFLPETKTLYPDSKEDCRKQKSLIDF